MVKNNSQILIIYQKLINLVINNTNQKITIIGKTFDNTLQKKIKKL